MAKTGRTCARCKTYKPASAFRVNLKMLDGLDSWCRQCMVDSTREWRSRNMAYQEAEREIKSTYKDPIAYSKNVCAHVASYVERRIRRFEQNSGMETPPQLRSILEIANTLAERQQPRGRIPGNSACQQCGKQYNRGRKDSRYCSERCKTRAQYLRRIARDPDLNRRKMAKRTPEQKARYRATQKARKNP